MLQTDTTYGLDATAVMDSIEEGILLEERETELISSENVFPPRLDSNSDLQQQQWQPLRPQEDKKHLEERPTSFVEEMEDDRTYLDLFGEVAKEFLTQKLIPTSDPECQWNWRHCRCEPVCLCDFQPKPGDFHLGRACRRRGFDVDEECTSEDDDTSLLRFIPTPVIKHMIQRIKQRSKSIQAQLSTKLEKAYDAIQVRVCEDLNHECRADDSAMTNNKGDRIFAWQEHLFCKEIIDDCTSGTKVSFVG